MVLTFHCHWGEGKEKRAWNFMHQVTYTLEYPNRILTLPISSLTTALAPPGNITVSYPSPSSKKVGMYLFLKKGISRHLKIHQHDVKGFNSRQLLFPYKKNILLISISQDKLVLLQLTDIPTPPSSTPTYCCIYSSSASAMWYYSLS